MRMGLRISVLLGVLAFSLVASTRDSLAAPIIVDLDDTHPGLTIYGAEHPPNSNLNSMDQFGYSLIHGHFRYEHSETHPYEDLVITAPFADGPDENRSGAGEAYLVPGSTSWGLAAQDVDLHAAEQAYTIYGADENDKLGLTFSMNSHGADVNGNGVDDIVISSPAAEDDGSPTNAGVIYVILGNADLGTEGGFGACNNGTDDDDDDLVDIDDPDCSLDLANEAPDLKIIGEFQDGGLGTGLAVRDVNGDDLNDIVASAPRADSERGVVYIIFGNEEFGVSVTEFHIDSPPVGVSVTTIEGADEGDLTGLGIEVRNVGGADSKHDILIGAPNAENVIPTTDLTDAGRLYLLEGREPWPAAIDLGSGDQTYTFFGEETLDQLGWSVYSGDADFDGLNDIIVSANGEDGPGAGTSCGSGETGNTCEAGGYRVFWGNSTWGQEGAGSCYNNIDDDSDSKTDEEDDDCYTDLSPGGEDADADITIFGGSSTSANQRSVHMGEITGDDYAEILIGEWNMGSGVGHTYALRGRPRGSFASSYNLASNGYDYRVVGKAAGYSPFASYSGWWVIALDINGDGISEIATSALAADSSTGSAPFNVGEVYVVFDSDLDGAPNHVDGCPLVGYGWITPIGDADCDGFASSSGPVSGRASEDDIGTNPGVACGYTTAGVPSPNWPPDLYASNTITALDAFAVTVAIGGPYNARFDLDGDGYITTADRDIVAAFAGKSCTP